MPQGGGAATQRYYLTDAQGSVAALEDASGQIAANERYSYDPYGALKDDDVNPQTDPEDDLGARAKANPFRFQGFYYDSHTQSYDMQARAYRPEIGRFLAQDRFADAGADLELQTDPLTQNRYVFAGGNPVSRIEFDGHHHGNANVQSPTEAARGEDGGSPPPCSLSCPTYDLNPFGATSPSSGSAAAPEPQPVPAPPEGMPNHLAQDRAEEVDAALSEGDVERAVEIAEGYDSLYATGEEQGDCASLLCDSRQLYLGFAGAPDPYGSAEGRMLSWLTGVAGVLRNTLQEAGERQVKKGTADALGEIVDGAPPLQAATAATFRSGRYSSKALDEDVVLYRRWGGTSPAELGGYWSRTNYQKPGNAKRYLALPPGNTAKNVTAIRVPAGTTIYEGQAAKQPWGAPGGGNQVVFEPGFEVPSSWIQR